MQTSKECLIENLKEESIVARSFVCDAVTELEDVRNLKITKELILTARNAHVRYKKSRRKEPEK